LYEVFGSERENHKVVRARSADNPYLDRALLAEWERTYTGDWARQELDAEWVTWSGLVYSEFDRNRHIEEPPQKFDRVIAGVDWGYRNPTAIEVIGIVGTRYWVVDEVYSVRLTVDDVISHSQALIQQYGITAFYCDPEDAAAIASLQRAGLPAIAAQNDVIPGIRHVASLIAHDQLRISSRCVHLLFEIEQYPCEGE
jgi:phage terminase large subunit